MKAPCDGGAADSGRCAALPVGGRGPAPRPPPNCDVDSWYKHTAGRRYDSLAKSVCDTCNKSYIIYVQYRFSYHSVGNSGTVLSVKSGGHVSDWRWFMWKILNYF